MKFCSGLFHRRKKTQEIKNLWVFFKIRGKECNNVMVRLVAMWWCVHGLDRFVIPE